MANLLGELWADGEPNWLALCGRPEVKIHLYGKLQPRPGRKMGHLCAMAADADAALRAVSEARECLVQFQPRGTACEDKAALQKTHAEAAAGFDAARGRLSSTIGISLEAEYEELNRAADQAWTLLNQARARLQQHIREHGCETQSTN